MSATSSEVEQVMWERISHADYEAVFASGGCFHFARFPDNELELKGERFRRLTAFGGEVHVWVLNPQGKAVDIRGIYDETITAAMAAQTVKPPSVKAIEAELIETEIRKMNFSPTLTAELDRLAHRIFYAHARFSQARPPTSASMQFVSEIEERRKLDGASTH